MDGILDRLRSVSTAAVRAVRHRSRRMLTVVDRRPRPVLVALAAAAAVLVGVTTTAAWWRADAADDRQAGLAAAVTTTTGLLSYDPDSVDGQAQRFGPELTAGFGEEYATLLTQAIGPSARERQLGTEARVVASSVVSAEGTRLVALLFVNHTTTVGDAEATPGGSRVRVTVENHGGQWLVADVEPV